jgi:hypothetical protein
MPVTGVHVGECPLNSAWLKTICNPGILNDVIVIVVSYKVVAKHPAKGDPNNYGKENTQDANDNATTLSGRTAAFGCVGIESVSPSIWGHSSVGRAAGSQPVPLFGSGERFTLYSDALFGD